RAHFLVVATGVGEMLSDEIEALVAPVLEREGYELIDVEFESAGGRSTLRLFIDAENGITLDDCERASNAVSGLLDVEDPVPGEYYLEMSSPGLDRPLRRPSHYERYVGALARVVMQKGYQGRRRLKGRLSGLEDEIVLLDVDGDTHRLPLEKIESARLVPEI
ncbi:MAG: ribosome maturation factor RimP, partial [Planctomycetota bacterium]